MFLVNLRDLIPEAVFEIKYASSDNFTGLKLYKTDDCLLHKTAGQALKQAHEALKPYGLNFKIFDGYRPLSVQQKMWDLIQDDRYISNPAVNGGRHPRGTAVDLTLVDLKGKEIEMPTPFDTFSEKAHRDYCDLPEKVLKNREFLKQFMIEHGFDMLLTEWWHFDLIGWENNSLYPPLDK